MKARLSPSGHVTAIVSGESASRVHKFPNVVLNSGWRELVTRSLENNPDMAPTWLFFGVSDAEPSPEQTGLIEREAGTANQSVSQTYGGFIDTTYLSAYSEVVLRFDYPAGAMTGEWSEIGLAFDSGYAKPYNRALIADENGVPTPLLVLSHESVTVYVRLRINLAGWGETMQIAEGVTGILQVKADMADPLRNIWKTGLPITRCLIGGSESKIEKFSLDEASAKHYFYVSQGAWSASSMNFYSSGGGNHFSFSLAPPIEKPSGKDMVMRFTLKY